MGKSTGGILPTESIPAWMFEYVTPQGRHTPISGERALAIALIESAVHDINKFRHVKSARGRRVYILAVSWVAYVDDAYALTFRQCAESLGFDADVLSAEIIRLHAPEFAAPPADLMVESAA